MKSNFLQRHQVISDALAILLFVFLVAAGTVLINTFIFQSFSVVGHSMDPTLADGQKVIVNRIPITFSNIANKNYVPKRGEIIVFENPQYQSGKEHQFIIKRVIAFPGEKIKVADGKITVYNKEHPEGFNPDANFNGEPKSYTSNDGEWTVPEGEIFVCGDNREGMNSYDSRSGLGTVPFHNIVGPVAFRLLPVTKIRNFEYNQQY